MAKNITILGLYILLCGVVVLGLTKEMYLRNTSPLEKLTPEMIKKSSLLSYEKLYHLDHPMRYRIDIDSEDGESHATLLWPQAPFNQILILIPYQNDELNQATSFEGQLVRCVYKCMPSNMYIEMFPIVEILEQAYPTLKGHYSQLPNKIFNTGAVSRGWAGYFHEARYHWMTFIFLATIGLVLFVRALIKGKKS